MGTHFSIFVFIIMSHKRRNNDDNDDEYESSSFQLPSGFGFSSFSSNKNKKRKLIEEKNKKKQNLDNLAMNMFFNNNNEGKGKKGKEKEKEREKEKEKEEEREEEREEDNDSDSDSTFDSNEELEINYDLPISHELKIKQHFRAITALAVEKKGGRFVTGSGDYTVKYYDFGGMDKQGRAFRTLEPQSGHVVRSLGYSCEENLLGVCPGGSQVKIYDRDGGHVCTMKKGDPYIRDLKQTKGHLSMVTCLDWHPNRAEIFASCSTDASIRIYDVNNDKSQLHVLKTLSMHQKRTGINHCKYSCDGNL